MVTSSQKQEAGHACIRPDDIDLSIDLSRRDGPNNLTGRVARIEDRGTASYVIVDVPPEMRCLVPRRRLSEMQLTPGQNVRITFDPDSVHVF